MVDGAQEQSQRRTQIALQRQAVAPAEDQRKVYLPFYEGTCPPQPANQPVNMMSARQPAVASSFAPGTTRMRAWLAKALDKSTARRAALDELDLHSSKDLHSSTHQGLAQLTLHEQACVQSSSVMSGLLRVLASFQLAASLKIATAVADVYM